MKEFTQENRNTDKLPLIRQTSQQRICSQTKLDRLLCEISNKNLASDHIRTIVTPKEHELGQKGNRALLKNVSTLSKINLRAKGEVSQLTKIPKKVELQSINDTLLTKKQSKQPAHEGEAKNQPLRVSINIKQQPLQDSLEQNQFEQQTEEVFFNSLEHFLNNHLASGVFCKSLAPTQDKQ